MPEIYRAFIIVLSLSYITFFLLKQAFPPLFLRKEIHFWSMIWLIIVIIVFLSSNIWLFFCFLTILLLILSKKPQNNIVYYLLLLSACPLLSAEIPGIGGIRYIILLNYQRLIIMILLMLPLIKSVASPKLFKLTTDYYILGFVGLVFILNFRQKTPTDSMREIFLVWVDILIPYFMLSRYLNSIELLNRGLIALLVGISPFGLIGIFETLKRWFLFSSLRKFYHNSFEGFDIRGNVLRASSVYSGPIVLGFVMLIGLGISLYIIKIYKPKRQFYWVIASFIGCLLGTVSRGPWIGTIALYLTYLSMGHQGIKNIFRWIIYGMIILFILSFTEIGSRFIEVLPFIGHANADTVDYRKRLIEKSWIVLQQNFWFGSTNFLQTPEMESMRQGQGIIDLVNTFICIVLPYGMIGLSLFLSILLLLLVKLYRILKRLPKQEIQLIEMGRVLLSIWVGIFVTIATVSFIDYIPIFYWALTGIITAYLNVAEKTIRSHKLKLSQNYLNSN